MDQSHFDAIIRDAIAAERAARDFYRAASLESANADTASLFDGLADDEEGHANRLEILAGDPALLAGFAQASDLGLAENLDSPDLSMDMTPPDAIALAIKKEQESVKTYSALAGVAENAELKTLFGQLADMELGHQKQLEALFVELTGAESW